MSWRERQGITASSSGVELPRRSRRQHHRRDGMLGPHGLAGVHLNLLTFFPTDVLAAVFGGEPVPEGLVKRVAVAVLAAHAEKKQPAALDAVAAVFKRGCFVEMPEHPQTIGYALTNAPPGWRPGCSTTTPTATQDLPRLSRRETPGGLTRGHILDNITLYWLTPYAGRSHVRIERGMGTCRSRHRALTTNERIRSWPDRATAVD